MTRRRRLALAAIALAGLAACSSGGSDAASTTVTTAAAPSTTAAGPTTSTEPIPDDPTIIVLTCDGATAKLSAPTVETRADGVHVQLRNLTDGLISINYNTGGDSEPPGKTDYVIARIAPGRLVLSCGYDENRRIVGAGQATVTDPGHHWAPMGIDCSTMRIDAARDIEPQFAATPEAAVTALVTGHPEVLLHPFVTGDAVRPVGYPDAARPQFVTTHDGKATNLFLTTKGDRGWTALPDEGCVD